MKGIMFDSISCDKTNSYCSFNNEMKTIFKTLLETLFIIFTLYTTTLVTFTCCVCIRLEYLMPSLIKMHTQVAAMMACSH